MIDYATLPRTPSGALTAASKRAVEEERVEQSKRMYVEFAKREVMLIARQKLEDAADAFDIASDDYAEPVTDREIRLVEEALRAGADEALADRLGDEEDSARYKIEGFIHYLRYTPPTALPTALKALEVLLVELASA